MPRPTKAGEAKTETNESTKEVVKDLTHGLVKKKDNKYRVNIVFDGELEEDIREAAARNGMPVATFIKWSVMQQINIK